MNKQRYLTVLICLVLGWGFAQECIVPEEVPAGIADELTTGFPEALDTPEKRNGVIADLLARFSGYYDMETIKQDRTSFKDKAAVATNEHDFYNVIREWVKELNKQDGWTEFTSARENGGSSNDFKPYAGIGMIVNGSDPKPEMLIQAIRPDGPAYEAGLQPGDKIVAINGEPCPGIAKIIGEENTELTITVQSPNQESRDLTLKRKLFTTDYDYSQAYRLANNSGIGYLRINNIDSYESVDTVRDVFKTLVDSVAQQPLEGLILDLRDSGGGSIDAIRKFSGHFFKSETGVFAERNSLGKDSPFYLYKQEPEFLDVPMVVLINEQSGEISVWLAAILAERSNTVLIGQPTARNPFSYRFETLRDGFAFFFPANLLVIRKDGDVKNDFMPLKDGRVAPDVLVAENLFPYTDNDSYIHAALAKLTKMLKSQQ